jgi:hypothetical protein
VDVREGLPQRRRGAEEEGEDTPESTSGSLPIMGIHIVDGVLPAPPPYSNGSVRVVRNQIHYVNWVIGNGYSGRAIQIRGVKNVQVQDNTVNVDPANPIRDQRNGQVGYFNNRTPEGTLIRGYKEDTNQLYNELETDAEEILVEDGLLTEESFR